MKRAAGLTSIPRGMLASFSPPAMIRAVPWAAAVCADVPGYQQRSSAGGVRPQAMLSVTPPEMNAHAFVIAACRASSSEAPATVRHFERPLYSMHTSQVAFSRSIVCTTRNAMMPRSSTPPARPARLAPRSASLVVQVGGTGAA